MWKRPEGNLRHVRSCGKLKTTQGGLHFEIELVEGGLARLHKGWLGLGLGLTLYPAKMPGLGLVNAAGM